MTPSGSPEQIQTPFNTRLILICADCGRQFRTPTHASVELKLHLLPKIDPLAPNAARLQLTDCLGVCPRDKISVVDMNQHTGKTVVYAVDPLKEREMLVNALELKGS